MTVQTTQQTTAPEPRVRDVPSRLALGRDARRRVPLESHASCQRAGTDAVKILLAQGATRVPELVPIRYGRMLASPFAFYRGSAAVMTADLATTPVTGFTVQACGDAHLMNFGLFASPERRLVFDINDFDETYPGPWEWDVKRLAASLTIAGRANGLRRKARGRIVSAAVGRYRQAMAEFAAMRELDVWYARADLADIGPALEAQLSKAWRKRMGKVQAKARTQDSFKAFKKLTTVVDGRRRIAAYPPLIVPLAQLLPTGFDADEAEKEVRELLDRYRLTLQPDRRHLFDAFQYVDMARKVVGVGSVGTRCWIVLLRGRDDDDPLLLQVKEAPESVLAPYLPPASTEPVHHQGERVVNGQRLMQATSDIFLGWQSTRGLDGVIRDFYVRQLKDWKGSAVVEEMDAEVLAAYASLCAWTLARAHARTGDRIAIAAYLGDEPVFDHALADFAETYADLAEHDYAELDAARRSGVIAVQSGI